MPITFKPLNSTRKWHCQHTNKPCQLLLNHSIALGNDIANIQMMPSGKEEICSCFMVLAARRELQIRLFLHSMTRLSNQFHSTVTVNLHFCLSACLSACLFVFLSIRMSVCLSVCLPGCLSVCRAFCLYVCLSAFLPVWLPVCLSFCLSAWFWENSRFSKSFKKCKFP